MCFGDLGVNCLACLRKSEYTANRATRPVGKELPFYFIVEIGFTKKWLPMRSRASSAAINDITILAEESPVYQLLGWPAITLG